MTQAPSPSNGIRGTVREHVVGITISALLLGVIPALWPTDDGAHAPGYRTPNTISEDYWLFRRRATRASAEADLLVFGDSVVWGRYVARGETLSAYLSQPLAVANLGLNGAHPAALAGLLEHHAGAVQNKGVILHCNPLWMSSPRLDLQEEKELVFNHPALVPQFEPWLSCYKATLSRRISNVVRRNLDVAEWNRHLQLVCFDQMDVPAWTLEHPYENPLTALTLELPAERALPQARRNLKPRTYGWVELEKSFQWASFRRAIRVLRQRGNRTLVLVGPFNEHLVVPADRAGLRALVHGITSWLKEEGVPHFVPEVLPPELYADASHPLAAGYARLAEELRESGLLEQVK